jgi:hypothetical protein
MLRGAVSFGEDFEENYMKQIFHLEKGMTQAISHFSRHDDARVKKTAGRYQYTGTSEKTAEVKVRRFYNLAIITLVITAMVLFGLTGHFRQNRGGSIGVVTTPAVDSARSPDGK